MAKEYYWTAEVEDIHLVRVTLWRRETKGPGNSQGNGQGNSPVKVVKEAELTSEVFEVNDDTEAAIATWVAQEMDNACNRTAQEFVHEYSGEQIVG